jgi:phage FluMu protein Com
VIKPQLNKMTCENCGKELLQTLIKNMQIKCPKCSHITSFGDYKRSDKSGKEKK